MSDDPTVPMPPDGSAASTERADRRQSSGRSAGDPAPSESNGGARSWYRKKRFLLPIVAVAAFMVGVGAGGGGEDAIAPASDDERVAELEDDLAEVEEERDTWRSRAEERAEELDELEEQLTRAGEAAEAAAEEPDAEPEPEPEPESAGEERLVEEFSGSNQHTTRPFRVESGWEVQWESTGDVFQIYVMDDGGDVVAVAANEQGPSEGSAFQPRGGSYYLDVNALGEWTIRVVQLP